MFVNPSIVKEILMQSNSAERFANEAVFQLQFNSRDAVRYIERNAGVDEKTARQALKEAVTFHRRPKVGSWHTVTV
jgi:DNA-directed RNA polymerase subunit F